LTRSKTIIMTMVTTKTMHKIAEVYPRVLS